MKRNQIMITALALMIAIAGYLNFAGNQMEGEMSEVVFSDEEEDVTALLDLTEDEMASDILSLDTNTDLEQVNDDTLTLTDTITDVVIDTDSASLEDEEMTDVPGEAVYTSTQGMSSLSGVKLIKEQTRAKNKATLLEIINSTSLSESQKQGAIDGMMEMTRIAEREMAAEILLESKGFDGAIVSIHDENVDVVVCTDELTEDKLAQIEDIVVRKTGATAENIVISSVKQ